jgi:hypothetical protein
MMKRIMIAIVALTLVSALGCSVTPGDTQLVPESRDGMFYTVFAEAQREAVTSDKYILLEMWRPG